MSVAITEGHRDPRAGVVDTGDVPSDSRSRAPDRITPTREERETKGPSSAEKGASSEVEPSKTGPFPSSPSPTWESVTPVLRPKLRVEPSRDGVTGTDPEWKGLGQKRRRPTPKCGNK